MVKFILILVLFFNFGCKNSTLTDRVLDSELRCKQYCNKYFPEFKHVLFSLNEDGRLKACECEKSKK